MLSLKKSGVKMAEFKKTIKLFLMDGKPNKRIKCSVAGTTCVAFKINREDLKKSSDRKELKQSGIYFLFNGTTDDSAKEVVYIGQASCQRKYSFNPFCLTQKFSVQFINLN